MNHKKYPGHLNPFGDEDDDNTAIDQDEYPDHLDPFGNSGPEENEYLNKVTRPVDDYDDSLNPFGDEQENEIVNANGIYITDHTAKEPSNSDSITCSGNPFEDDDDDPPIELPKQDDKVMDKISEETVTGSKISPPSQPQSLESLEPPKPLPRTKSLLKKELALKRRLQEQSNQQSAQLDIASKPEIVIQNSSSTQGSCNISSTSNGVIVPTRRKKRIVPPVPVDYKREVTGSLEIIEKELNEIGDNLAFIEKESINCQEMLKTLDASKKSEISATKAKLVKLIREKSSIVKRQKELMYGKRELKLDQIYSDIEYELRMIGNKHLSSRTSEDEEKEKELLKKLVEIVDEKNDIVENLNKDSSCDRQDIEDTFKRLNIVEHLPRNKDKKLLKNLSATLSSPRLASKNMDCDKSNLNKLSKIATLLPKGNTIKDTMKIKRKRLFKKNCEIQQQPNSQENQRQKRPQQQQPQQQQRQQPSQEQQLSMERQAET